MSGTTLFILKKWELTGAGFQQAGAGCDSLRIAWQPLPKTWNQSQMAHVALAQAIRTHLHYPRRTNPSAAT